MRVTVNAPAKINLTLNMEGIREDGYHLLSSVFQAISLADEVIIESADSPGIHLSLSDPQLPCDERNTAYKAARVFFERVGCTPSVNIRVAKMIPQQAGLGGGSADAAGVLVGLNAIYGEPLSEKEMCDLGETVGADVPFCIVGGTAMVKGIGEIITPIKPLTPCAIVVAKPPVGVSTKEAYAAVDRAVTVPADQQAMVEAIERADLKAVGKYLSNAFEQALHIEQVSDILKTMRSHSPLGCMMSGSGSAVYAIFEEAASARALLHSLPKTVHTYLCEPLAVGATVTEISKG